MDLTDAPLRPRRRSVTEWHPYADKWYPRELLCPCGAVKPEQEHPKGGFKRYRAKIGHTEALCPACAAEKGLA